MITDKKMLKIYTEVVNKLKECGIFDKYKEVPRICKSSYVYDIEDGKICNDKPMYMITDRICDSDNDDLLLELTPIIFINNTNLQKQIFLLQTQVYLNYNYEEFLYRNLFIEKLILFSMTNDVNRISFQDIMKQPYYIGDRKCNKLFYKEISDRVDIMKADFISRYYSEEDNNILNTITNIWYNMQRHNIYKE